LSELVDIAREFLADKRPATLRLYERYFREFRETTDSILEIGVKHGGSIQAWEQYFPNARIIGMDINPEPSDWPRRATFVQGDQGDRELLLSLAERFGPFDAVIDDGSHRMDHQRLSFEVLWPHVKPGGLFVIEDIHTSYRDKYQVEGVQTSMAMLIDELPSLVLKGAGDIEAITFAHATAVIAKQEVGASDERSFHRVAKLARR
jgi:23S rRNA U2552 (ribose-2'-O)-methylase RlmE/FtsJ